MPCTKAMHCALKYEVVNVRVLIMQIGDTMRKTGISREVDPPDLHRDDPVISRHFRALADQGPNCLEMTIF